jgi:ketosteroid isomerase-like protein
MKRILAAAAFATALPLSALAFDNSDRAAVQAVTQSFAQNLRAKNFEGVLNAMPPKILNYMSQQTGIPANELAGTLARQMSVFMGDVTVERFNMNMNRMATGTTNDGIDFAFIPTRTTVKGPEGRQTTNTQTLALQDGGQWYLVRIEQAQQYEIVKAVYPGFANVRLP